MVAMFLLDICFKHQENFSKHSSLLKDTTFDYLSGIFIPGVLIIIISCHIFSRVKPSNVIFHDVANLCLKRVCYC